MKKDVNDTQELDYKGVCTSCIKNCKQVYIMACPDYEEDLAITNRISERKKRNHNRKDKHGD